VAPFHPTGRLRCDSINASMSARAKRIFRPHLMKPIFLAAINSWKVRFDTPSAAAPSVVFKSGSASSPPALFICDTACAMPQPCATMRCGITPSKN